MNLEKEIERMIVESGLQDEENNKQLAHSIAKYVREQVELDVKPEQLHKWYLEAIKKLHPDSYNPKAQIEVEGK